MDIEALGLEAGETVGDDQESFADGIEMIESFLQAEVARGCWSRVRCAGSGRTFRTA